MNSRPNNNLGSRLKGILSPGSLRATIRHGTSDDLNLSSPAAGVRSGTAAAHSSFRWLWTALLFICLAPFQAIPAQSADRFVNRAELQTAELPSSVGTVTVTLQQSRTSSTVEFLKYAPGVTGAISTPIAKTSYSNSAGSFTEVNPPVSVGTGTVIDLSSPLPLIKSALFHAGEPLFIRVTDLDQNLDRNVAETVIITVTDPKTGDRETLKLTENGTNTGIFIGYIQTAAASTDGANSGILYVTESSAIQANYIDIMDGTDSSAAAALVDPFGIVFDTITGKPVDGATVELLNADGTAAAVLGDSGLPTNSYPNSVISGSIARDSEGNTYSFTPGGYRFPFVNPGNYILKITPPTTYSSPSTVTTVAIQALPGAPFTILEPGSRGEIFAVPAGPAIRVDIPLDPKIGSLWLRKSAGKSLVSAGEYLSYDITLENNDPVGTLFSPVITDKLPPGFRYLKGSARTNGLVAPDPAISADGSSMTFALANIPPATSVTIRYVVAVGAGAKIGTAANTALATSTASVKSNIATATVQVQEPFMQSRNIIMGRVFVGACSENADDNKKGMEGIGIYLEDGTFVNSDKFGMFHFEGVRSGTHVVQLDLDSIPEGYRILPCEQNSRFAGRAYSQFVDLQGGTMWRTDFYLGKVELTPPTAANLTEKNQSAGKNSQAALFQPTAEEKVKALTAYNGEISLEMLSSQNGEFIDYRIPLQTATVPLTNLRLTVILPSGAIYVNGSSNLDGSALPDPTVTADRILSFQLGAASADWQKELHFRVVINRKAKGGELQTKADLTFDSPITKNITTPAVDNILSLIKEERRLALPTITVRPQFPTFGAELSPEDRKQLDELAQMLSRFNINHIDVAGHTDIVRIAPRSRNIYADNTALSFARAKSVGRYLTAALHLPPESLILRGSGEREPIATNRTAAGRTLNRRVEVNVSAAQTIETSRLKITKERSGLKKQATTGETMKQSGEEPGLSPLQPKYENMVVLPASNATEAVIPAESSPVAAPPVQVILQEKSAAQKNSAAPVSAKDDERVELVSAISEGMVHYRIKLVGVKDPLKKISATLVTPKSFLYMSGTTRLLGATAADPATKEAVITYNFATLADEKKFDLRLQALIDGDDQTESLASSVTVVIADADGKPLKTLTANCELSDNMDELNRADIPAAAQTSTSQKRTEKDDSATINEYVEKAHLKGENGKTESPNSDSGLHVMENEGILSPADGTILAARINAVRIVLNSSLTPALSIDGKEVAADRIGFSMKDSKSEKSLYTFIGVDFGDAGEHLLRLKGLDTFGVARFDKTAKITLAGEIATIKIISAEGNIADGKTPVRVRIQLFDKDDKQVSANAELTLKSDELRPLAAAGLIGQITNNGMVTVDSEGWINFQPVTASGNYRAQISYNKAILDFETYVKPKMRNWILVGLAEGTVGYNTLSGHMENLKSSGQEENLYDKERLALYAKGTIKGEWLLTMAYDSAKRSTGVNGNGLFQTIDPNSYYTIYGDSTAQLYDAASQKKLYLKIERDQFYAMFGDFDTNLTVTELSRYSRRMNGLKSEFSAKNYEVTVFGSETGQSFMKDELRGDGTSGLYRLSRKGLVINSEKITIESRDRFHSETVTESRQLGRFVDYSIDYDNGTIFFKGPVPSRDEQLNPVYIVVDYEIADAGKDALTYGGRAGAKLLDNSLKVGGSYIHEGHVSGANNLYGADAAMTLAPGTKVRAEIAATNSDTSILRASGNAYLAEVTHTDKELDGKAYYRQQDSGFGLGQQKGSEAGTRKFGAEGAYKLNKDIVLSSQAYRQYNLIGGTVRDFVESLGTYSDKQLSARAGLRYANDTLADGSNKTSVLGTAGVSVKTLKERLTLRADHDQALFSKDKNADFPTRTTLGADYQATKQVMLFAQEEMTYGAAANTNTTRVGVKATPWSGGTLASSVVNDIKENSARTFANVGLAQKWQLNPFWTVDGGLDHSRTIQKKTGYQLSATVPPASGGDDFTAVSFGANYQEKKLLWSNRVEYRNSDGEDKWGMISGVVNEQGLNWGWTTRLQLLHTQSVGGNSRTDADLRLGLAYRPPVTNWILLDRLDMIATDEKSALASALGKRFVNNLNANYKPDKKTQLSIQYGAKYVMEKIDDMDYSGYTDLIGLEGRYDITKEWDIGLRCALLHSWESNQYAYSVGPSVGYNVMENAWISGGYNFAGFKDRDFSTANYTAQGPFVQFRFKFDQNSVKDGLKALNQ